MMNEREGDIERWNMAFKHTFIFIDAIFVYNTHMYLNIYVLLFYTNESPCRTFNVLIRCVLHGIFIL